MSFAFPQEQLILTEVHKLYGNVDITVADKYTVLDMLYYIDYLLDLYKFQPIGNVKILQDNLTRRLEDVKIS